MAPPLTLVLDTNVVLDWLVFRDTTVEGLRRALNERRVTVLTHTAAIEELRRVLAYPQCKLASDQQQELLARYRTSCHEVALGDLSLPAGFPRCRDTDDQHFLALAYHAKANGLLTKDRDLLRLRKRAAKFGVAIASPAGFIWS